MPSKHSHPLAPCSAPCSRFCIATEAVPFVSSLPRTCHASANLPRDASQAHSCHRAVALVFCRSALSHNLLDICAACAHIVSNASRKYVRTSFIASLYVSGFVSYAQSFRGGTSCLISASCSKRRTSLQNDPRLERLLLFL